MTNEIMNAINAGTAPAQPVFDGHEVISQITTAVREETIADALTTLDKYKQGKANYDSKIKENEEWFRLRHWSVMQGDKKSQVKPASGWLLNSILNKHADAMDNYPEPNVLPREESDRQTAKELASVLPVILERNDFEEIYNRVEFDRLKKGTGIYGVYWDGNKLNGLGDITIQRVDALELFWEPGITDIQDSENVFLVKLVNRNALLRDYPQLEGKNLSRSVDTVHYAYEDNIDTTDKVSVIDWYYHKDGKLQYCKFVPGTVLFASENSPEEYPNGWYRHGKYPFVVDICYPVEASVGGFGFIDSGKNTQMYIDVCNQAIQENMLANCKPRYLQRKGTGIDAKQYLDFTQPVVEYEGDATSIIPMQGAGLSSIYVDYLTMKIDELKETTGNRDVATGGTTGGVTAASAISAMQEQAGKLSRDATKASYRAYKTLIYMVIELIREFYDVPRMFRITNEMGGEEYLSFSNAGMLPQPQGNAFGVDLGSREPIFDIYVTAQKQSPYAKLSQNELALQFYQLQFFNPANSDQALACLDMMDFSGKERIMQKIQQNAMIYQGAMAMMQADMDAGIIPGGEGKMPESDEQKGASEPKTGRVTPEQNKSDIVSKAREKAAQTTAV